MNQLKMEIKIMIKNVHLKKNSSPEIICEFLKTHNEILPNPSPVTVENSRYTYRTHMYVLIAQLCPTFCDPMDCSPPGSFIHAISQTRILEWVAIPFSRGSSRPRDQTQVSFIAGRFFII